MSTVNLVSILEGKDCQCQRSRGKRKKHLADWEILCQHLRTFLLSRYLENVLEERKKTFLHVMHSQIDGCTLLSKAFNSA
jgi:hypothetical protein